MVAALVQYTPLYLFLPIGGYLFWKRRDRIDVRLMLAYLAIVLVPLAAWMSYSSQFRPMWGSSSFVSLVWLANFGYYVITSARIGWGANPLVAILALYFLVYAKKREDYFTKLWLLGAALYLFGVMPKAMGNNYYVAQTMPVFCFAAGIGLDRIKLKFRKEYLLVLALLVSAPLVYVLYDVEYPYADAGIYLRDRLEAGDTIGWVESAVPCYYAEVLCAYVHPLDNLIRVGEGKNYVDVALGRADLPYAPETRHLKYVVIPSTYEKNYQTEDYGQHLEQNYELEKTIEGKVNLLGGDYRRKTEKEYVRIYRRIE
ncbi:MAG: hypothetical protein ABH829_02875 [archaeon]